MSNETTDAAIDFDEVAMASLLTSTDVMQHDSDRYEVRSSSQQQRGSCAGTFTVNFPTALLPSLACFVVTW